MSEEKAPEQACEDPKEEKRAEEEEEEEEEAGEEWRAKGYLAPRGRWRDTLLTTEEMPEGEMRALIDKFRPVVALHPKENALPCTSEWYLAHAQLRFGGRTKKSLGGLCGGKYRSVVVKEPPLTMDDVMLTADELAARFSAETRKGGALHGIKKPYPHLVLNPLKAGGMKPELVRVASPEGSDALRASLAESVRRTELLIERAPDADRKRLRQSRDALRKALEAAEAAPERTVPVHRAPCYAFVRAVEVPTEGNGLRTQPKPPPKPKRSKSKSKVAASPAPPAKQYATRGVYEIVYVFMFASNPGPPVCCSCWRVGQGTKLMHAHSADFERVTVRVDRETGAVWAVKYAGHGYRDGYWRQFGDYRRRGHRPVAGSALGSHAMYYSGGLKSRLCWVGSDHVSFGGLEWDPERVVIANLDRPGTAFMDAQCEWSDRGVGSVWTQRWCLAGEAHTTNSKFRRLFTSCCPCVEEKCLFPPADVVEKGWEKTKKAFKKVEDETEEAIEWIFKRRTRPRRLSQKSSVLALEAPDDKVNKTTALEEDLDVVSEFDDDEGQAEEVLEMEEEQQQQKKQ